MTEPGKVEKVDPESLVLRAKPRRVIRIKRNLLIGVAAAGCVCLVGLIWLGLAPSLIHPATPAVDDKDPEKHKAGLPDVVTALPKTYANVPQLGEPLPGDLGWPILEARRAHAEERRGAAGPPAPNCGHVNEAGETARTSALFFQTGGVSAPVTPLRPSADGDFRQLIQASPSMSPPSVQIAKVNFLEAGTRSATTNPYQVQVPPSANMVMAGTVISAALITGLNSDLPGTVMAQVTSDVPDSLTGRKVLIPHGTRLIGKYDSTISFGQSRVLVIWQRLIWPDGRSLEIDNLPASGLDGFGGLKDGVSFHTMSLLQGIGLSTLMGVAGELGKDSDDDLVKAIREATQETANQAGQKIVSRKLDVQPTLTVRPGWPLRVIVQKDLIISTGASDD